MRASMKAVSIVGGLALAISGSVGVPANSSTGMATPAVVQEGSCAGRTDWKLRLAPRGRNLEITWTISGSNRLAPSIWETTIVHNGEVVSISVLPTASEHSYSISYLATVHDGPRTDHVTGRSENKGNGEVCFGKARSDF